MSFKDKVNWNEDNSLALRDEILDRFDPEGGDKLDQLQYQVDSMATPYQKRFAVDGHILGSDSIEEIGKRWAMGGSTGRIYNGDVSSFLKGFFSSEKVDKWEQEGSLYDHYSDLIGRGFNKLLMDRQKIKKRTSGYKKALAWLSKKR